MSTIINQEGGSSAPKERLWGNVGVRTTQPPASRGLAMGKQGAETLGAVAGLRTFQSFSSQVPGAADGCQGDTKRD